MLRSTSPSSSAMQLISPLSHHSDNSTVDADEAGKRTYKSRITILNGNTHTDAAPAVAATNQTTPTKSSYDIPTVIFPVETSPSQQVSSTSYNDETNNNNNSNNRVKFNLSCACPTMDNYDNMDYEAENNNYNDDNDIFNLQPAPSFVSTATSVMTAEGLADTEGFWIVCSVVLISDMSRGVTFPIMYPLIVELGGNAVWLGYIVGAFSLGRVIASPILGRSTIVRGYSTTLVASTTVLLIGCILFAHANEVGNLYFLVFSQIILGIGSGTLGVTRAYVAEITATRQRTTYLALLTAVQYGAFTVTPIFGSLFIHLLDDRRYEVG
jgi:hypothetical protein